MAKVRMAGLPSRVYVAKDRKPPFYTPEELVEVMEQKEKITRKPCRFKFNSVFDALPSVVRG